MEVHFCGFLSWSNSNGLKNRYQTFYINCLALIQIILISAIGIYIVLVLPLCSWLLRRFRFCRFLFPRRAWYFRHSSLKWPDFLHQWPLLSPWLGSSRCCSSKLFIIHCHLSFWCVLLTLWIMRILTSLKFSRNTSIQALKSNFLQSTGRNLYNR